MRIYIPATSRDIERLVLDGQLEVAHAFAVTAALREWYSGDDEELEYLATLAAARASLDLLDDAVLARRVVLAADVDSAIASARPGEHRALVEVHSTLPRSAFAAALVDGLDAEADVQHALAMLPGASSDEDARFAVDQAQSHELLWFAAEEFPFVF